MTDNLDERLAEVERDIDDQGSPSLDDSRWLVRRLRDALAENQRLKTIDWQQRQDWLVASTATITAERDALTARLAKVEKERDQALRAEQRAVECWKSRGRDLNAAEAKLAAANLINEQLLVGGVDLHDGLADIIAAISGECLANRAKLAAAKEAAEPLAAWAQFHVANHHGQPPAGLGISYETAPVTFADVLRLVTALGAEAVTDR